MERGTLGQPSSMLSIGRKRKIRRKRKIGRRRAGN